LKAFLLCLLIGGSGVGYVWQKSQIYELGKMIKTNENKLTELREQNKKLGFQLHMLRSPRSLENRVRELNLGLGPPRQASVIRLLEPAPTQRVEAGQNMAARPGAAP
jgi:hypothetical protein